MDDQKLVVTKLYDDQRLLRDGTLETLLVAHFFVGNLGPFDERIMKAEGAEAELRRRVELRAQEIRRAAD